MPRQTNNNILVPTDFSDVAECAVKHAINVAKAYKNEITLMYVIEEGLLGSIFSKSQSDLLKDAMQTKLQVRAEAIAKETGIKISTRIG